MKPALEYLAKGAEESFVVRAFEYNYYPTPWHFHPEYEIVLVTQSSGKRFIGDHISNFGPGNLVMLGSNLPHLYRNDPLYYNPASGLHAGSIVVHFSDESFGAGFFNTPETKEVRQLFARSRQGIEITGAANERVSRMLQELVCLKGFSKTLLLLEILRVLSEDKHLPLISTSGVAGINEKESERMNSVLDFLVKNFSADICRADVARVSHMSENAFSRYFSQRTRKTFSHYLNELRLSHAARLLIENDSSVADVCYACGFNNLSNFNRQFKMTYQSNPLHYRKAYWDKAGR